MEPQPQVVTSQTGKKTNKPLIFGIVGVLILTAAVAAGVILVSQNQDIRSLADRWYARPDYGTTFYEAGEGGTGGIPGGGFGQEGEGGWGNVDSGESSPDDDSPPAPAAPASQPSTTTTTTTTTSSSYAGFTFYAGQTTPLNIPSSDFAANIGGGIIANACPVGITGGCNNDTPGNLFSDVLTGSGDPRSQLPPGLLNQSFIVQFDYPDGSFVSYVYNPSGGEESGGGGGDGGGGEEPPPPPPPGVAAQCVDIRFYDLSWNKLTISDLTKLSANNIIRIAVAGSATSGGIDPARFTVNGTQLAPTTQQRATSQEFYTDYKIPEGVTTFTIGAQVHHPTLGWF